MASLRWLSRWTGWGRRPRARVSALVLAGLGALGACGEGESATDLNPEGPPMVRQVFMDEAFVNSGGSRQLRRVLAFGTHPDADPNTIKAVTTAIADSGQNIRVVFDELLIGNYLEEISCRGQVDDDAYDEVPLGATPDNIADCAVPDDELPFTCTGEFAVCVGPDPANPVGVFDILNGQIPPDGAPDDLRMIAGAVKIICDDIDVPIDQQNSYWQPSGTQLVPAEGGLNALGPAVVIATAAGLPTSTDCRIEFAERVVDKDFVRPCAPEAGDITKDCTPGDLSLLTFSTEPLIVRSTTPTNNAMNVPLLRPARTYSEIVLEFTVPVAAASVENITISPLPANPYTVVIDATTPQRAALRFEGGYAANTTYTLTIPTTVTDAFGQALPQAVTVTFTTGS